MHMKRLPSDGLIISFVEKEKKKHNRPNQKINIKLIGWAVGGGEGLGGFALPIQLSVLCALNRLHN